MALKARTKGKHVLCSRRGCTGRLGEIVGYPYRRLAVSLLEGFRQEADGTYRMSKHALRRQWRGIPPKDARWRWVGPVPVPGEANEWRWGAGAGVLPEIPPTEPPPGANPEPFLFPAGPRRERMPYRERLLADAYVECPIYGCGCVNVVEVGPRQAGRGRNPGT